MPLRFRNLSLLLKQLLGFAGLVVIMVSLNVFFINRIGELKEEVDRLTRTRLPTVVAITDINQTTTELRLTQLQLAASNDSTASTQLQLRAIELLDQINASRDDYERLRDAVEDTSGRADEYEVYADYDATWDAYQELSLDFFDFVERGRTEEAVALLNGAGRDLFDQLSAQLQQLVRLNRKAAERASERAEITYHKTRGTLVIIFVLSIGVAVGFSLALRRYVIRPVRLLADAVEHVKEGDYDQELPVPGEDEISRLARSFNQMTDALARARRQTEEQAEALRGQASELLKTNAQLEEKSLSLERQKAKIEEVNRNLEEAMTQLRSTQEQLLLKEKMASLGNLVAGVAHEINNPIGAVLSSGDIARRLVDQLRDSLSEPIRADRGAVDRLLRLLDDNIRNTLTGSQRVAKLVRSLRSFARLDEAEYQTVDLHEGIEASLALLGSEAMQGIEVVREYGDLPKVPCYPGQLNQVFLSLLKNAVEAIDGSGKITITTRHRDGNVEIEFTDDGRGIPTDRLERIFDVGFSSSGRRVKMGSGLISAYGIVQRHDGEISVESTVGDGTTVRLRLPRK